MPVCLFFFFSISFSFSLFPIFTKKIHFTHIKNGVPMVDYLPFIFPVYNSKLYERTIAKKVVIYYFSIRTMHQIVNNQKIVTNKF